MIRPAVPADVPVLLDLVRELAAYEREPDAVEATEASLHEVLFGPDAGVSALVAEVDGDAGPQVVGCAIWFVNYSTWTGRHGLYLEDLVVRESARRGGHGRALLAALAAICVERGWPRLEWAVLNWNEPALAFYRALGAVGQTGWTVHRVSGPALPALAASGGDTPDRR